jgi:hypothetical protein
MNFYSGRILALRTQAEICNARIAAMQAANQEREHKGEAQAYNEKAFMDEANELGRIYDQIHNLAENAG